MSWRTPSAPIWVSGSISGMPSHRPERRSRFTVNQTPISFRPSSEGPKPMFPLVSHLLELERAEVVTDVPPDAGDGERVGVVDDLVDEDAQRAVGRRRLHLVEPHRQLERPE